MLNFYFLLIYTQYLSLVFYLNTVVIKYFTIKNANNIILNLDRYCKHKISRFN